MNGYGALNWDDVMVLEAALNLAGCKGRVSFLEIGVYNGETAEGIKRFCDNRQIELEYTGIDVTQPPRCPPFEGAGFIMGKSSEVFFKAGQGWDIIFIDASHSLNSVMLDIIHYSPRVILGGYMLFHDTAPAIQGKMTDPDGPPELHSQVLWAMREIKWPFDGWVRLAQSCRLAHTFGGMQLYWKQS